VFAVGSTDSQGLQKKVDQKRVKIQAFAKSYFGHAFFGKKYGTGDDERTEF